MRYILFFLGLFIFACSDSGTEVLEGQEMPKSSSSSLNIYLQPKSSSSSNSLQVLRPGIELTILQVSAPNPSNYYYKVTFKNNTGTDYKTFSLDYYFKCNWTKTNSTSGDTLLYNSSTFALSAYETLTKNVGYLATASTYQCSMTITTVRGSYVEPWQGTFTYP